MTLRQSLLRLFDHIWRYLAQQGKCDDIGGMQYKRILKKWKKDGMQIPIAPMIEREANIGPPTGGAQ